MKEGYAEHFEIADIIALHMQGKANEEQERILDAWLKENEENKRLYAELLDPEKTTELISGMRHYSGEDVMHQILADKRSAIKRRSTILWRSAAAVVLLIGMAGGYYFIMKDQTPVKQEMSQAVSDIDPAQQRAVLVLKNGQKLQLHAAMDSSFQVGGSTVQLNGDSARYTTATTNDAAELQVLETPKGSTFKMVLADGSKVWLNAGSSIKYPSQFTAKERKVEITGEVYFEVSADPSHPFVVLSKGTEVKAIGTAFNVRAYDLEENQTSLVSGAVIVKREKEEYKLAPGTQASEVNGAIQIAEADLSQVTAWQKGLFLFKRTTAREVLEEIERWYNVRVVYQDGFTGDDLFHVKVSREITLQRLLPMLDNTGLATFRLEGRTVYVAPKHRSN